MDLPISAFRRVFDQMWPRQKVFVCAIHANFQAGFFRYQLLEALETLEFDDLARWVFE